MTNFWSVTVLFFITYNNISQHCPFFQHVYFKFCPFCNDFQMNLLLTFTGASPNNEVYWSINFLSKTSQIVLFPFENVWMDQRHKMALLFCLFQPEFALLQFLDSIYLCHMLKIEKLISCKRNQKKTITLINNIY